MARAAAFVLVAALLYVLLTWGIQVADERFDPLGGVIAPWYELLQPPLRTIAYLIPGFLLGYVARRNGFLLGVLAGLLAGPVELWVVFTGLGIWHETFVALIASHALSTALQFGVAGAAGELFASRQPKSRPAIA